MISVGLVTLMENKNKIVDHTYTEKIKLTSNSDKETIVVPYSCSVLCSVTFSLYRVGKIRKEGLQL